MEGMNQRKEIHKSNNGIKLWRKKEQNKKKTNMKEKNYGKKRSAIIMSLSSSNKYIRINHVQRWSLEDIFFFILTTTVPIESTLRTRGEG